MIQPPLLGWTNFYQAAEGVLWAGFENLQGCSCTALLGNLLQCLAILIVKNISFGEAFLSDCTLNL